MENNRIATTIMMVLMSLKMGVAEIVTKPTVTEVVVGGSAFLNCSTNIRQEIHWFHTPVGPTQERNFVYGYDQFYSPYIGRFQMEKNEANGEYNLVIPSVKMEDAGVYECQDETGRGSKVSAQLIVLDTNPVCEPHMDMHKIIGPNKCGIEPNQVILSCTVKYLGNEAPILEWRRASDNISVSEGVTHGAMDNNRVVYNLTIKGNSTVEDGDSYFCNTTRSAMSNYECKSGKIKVEGTVVDVLPYTDDQICQPYINAIICILLIILPVAIFGTVLVLWYLCVYRPKKLQQKDRNEEQELQAPTTQSAEDAWKAKTGETNQTTTEAADVKNPLLPDRSGEPNSGLKSKNKTLENENRALLERIQRRDKTITEGNQTIKDGNQIIGDLKETDELNKAKITNLQLENDQLQAKIKELEQHLYPKENIDYLDKPVLAHTIELSEKNKGKSIIGITVLSKELFVVPKLSQEIEVYDSKTFQHERFMEIVEMTDPLDIASSKDANFLYIVGRLSEETESKVMRLDPFGKVLHQWPTGGKNGRLSTYGSNVILCLSDKQLINEYSSDGELLATVRLSPAAKLNNPLHAIKVTSTCFVVSHGDINDELHRVCLVDLDGEIKNECTKWEKSKDTSRVTMKVPICLVEDSERYIIVADLDNKRILLLTSMLKYQRKLIEEKNDLTRLLMGKENGLTHFPVRLGFDDTQSRLFVAAVKCSNKGKWEDGRILIFNIK